RDGRRSSPTLADLVRAALQASGARVVDLGLTLTPTVQYAVATNPGLAGGVMITASHNPVVWNGLKFLDAEGRFLPLERWAEMEAIIAEERFRTVALDQLVPVEAAGEAAWQAHQAAILAALPVEAIRARRLRLAFDACNSGAVRWQSLFAALGCETIPLHTELTGFFAREAEPLPQHLGALAHLVCAAGCDLGLAADPDGDRLVLVDEHGQAVSEEHTVVLCARERLAAGAGDTVVVNVVTTHAIDEAFLEAEIWRTAVGEMNVVNGLLEAYRPALGGEGSGGIIVPGVNLARDGGAAAGLILSLLATTGRPLSTLVAEIPPWSSVKSKLTITSGDLEAARALFAAWQVRPPLVRFEDYSTVLWAGGDTGQLRLRLTGGHLNLELELDDGRTLAAEGDGRDLALIFASLPETAGPEHMSFLDGLKVWGPQSWLSLRPSNTEPILRVMGEMRDSR
ncbi:MAG TPA: hypothetical protein DEP84_00895, partial [Chloroflexi bacterium]|nr:hypothetical protein [Chloroflexota bacterium]